MMLLSHRFHIEFIYCINILFRDSVNPLNCIQTSNENRDETGIDKKNFTLVLGKISVLEYP